MLVQNTIFALAAAGAASAAQLLICSDSTTANYAVGNPLQGWGYYINNYTTLTINNLAKNGRSTRSFINEGLWDALLKATQPGDFVVIEHGHNDDVDPTTDTKDRGTLPGTGDKTVVVTTSKGTQETVHTFGWYLTKMIDDVKAKKATPIISGMVNRNYWTGDVLQKDWPFADTAKAVAATNKVEYLDHTAYSVALFQSYGATKAKTFYPNDNTHTNWPGAELNTKTFVQAIKCHCGTKSVLAATLNTAGKSVQIVPCQKC
ncbi:Rhamnogalacturonan acetylesterase-like protein [Elsinoe fawcettii]|nr:Rhamnogalacturonan acetylesterase-like protein [Elsinoe fawcettii]